MISQQDNTNNNNNNNNNSNNNNTFNSILDDGFAPFDVNNLSSTTLDQLIDNNNNNNISSSNNNDNVDFFSNPFDDTTYINPLSSNDDTSTTTNILLTNNNNQSTTTTTTDIKHSNALPTPTLNDLLSNRSESPRTIIKPSQRSKQQLYPFNNREISPTTNIDTITNNDNIITEPSTTFYDLFNDVVSNEDPHGGDDDDDDDEEHDDFNRRHSDVLLNNSNSSILPVMTPTSRASISHQFDMWTGLQRPKSNNNTYKAKNNIINPIPRNDNNNNNNNTIANMLDEFNLNFTDPFDKTNNNLIPSSDITTSPQGDRRYSIRKIPHRSSVPTIDMEILRRLSTSAAVMTPVSSNVSSSDTTIPPMTNNNNNNNNIIISQGGLSNDLTPGLDNFPPPQMSPDYLTHHQENNNQSYVSLPQRTIRSASVANESSSHRRNSTYTIPIRAFSPPPPPAPSHPVRSQIQQRIFSNPQQEQDLQPLTPQLNDPTRFNQYPINQTSQYISYPNNNNTTNSNNKKNSPPQPILNLPIQPIPSSSHTHQPPPPPPSQSHASQTSQQSILSMPSFGQPLNSSRIVSSSITVVTPNGNIDTVKADNANKPYRCEQCGKSFKRAEHMKRHIRSIHQQQRPYTCTYCNKKFSRNDNLQQHTKIHERRASEKRREIQLPMMPPYNRPFL